VYNEQVKEPSYWSGRLNQMVWRGMTLDEIAKESEEYGALTAKQVKETVARYYSKDNTIIVVVKPKSSDATTQKTAAAGD
jgi:predicted Zn-dependent peptidase